MIKVFLIIFLANITLSQLFANNRCELKHAKMQIPEFIFEQEEPFIEQDLASPAVDDFLDLMWEELPPFMQKIILCFGGVGLLGIALSYGYPIEY